MKTITRSLSILCCFFVFITLTAKEKAIIVHYKYNKETRGYDFMYEKNTTGIYTLRIEEYAPTSKKRLLKTGRTITNISIPCF